MNGRTTENVGPVLLAPPQPARQPGSPHSHRERARPSVRACVSVALQQPLPFVRRLRASLTGSGHLLSHVEETDTVLLLQLPLRICANI